MPTATVQTIYCVQQATGTDSGLNTALADPPGRILPNDMGMVSVDVIRAMPGVMEAIDTARSDPDDLYITTETAGGRNNAIWPAPGQSSSTQAGQSFSPQLELTFDYSQNLSLWDYDSVSDDDLLGSVTLLAEEQGQGDIAKKASSTVENSVYYVVYRVD